MVPAHVRGCFDGTLREQLAHLAADVERLQGFGLSGGPKKLHNLTGRPRGGSPMVVVPKAARVRILARNGADDGWREAQSVVARELGLSLSMVKKIRTESYGGAECRG